MRRESAIPDNMYVHAFTYDDSALYYQSISPVLCSFLTKEGIFLVPVSLHTRTHPVFLSRFNWVSSVSSTWLHSRCIESQCSSAKFFVSQGLLRSKEYSLLPYVHRGQPGDLISDGLI